APNIWNAIDGADAVAEFRKQFFDIGSDTIFKHLGADFLKLAFLLAVRVDDAIALGAAIITCIFVKIGIYGQAAPARPI
ncbi:MAG: hypothetical protein HZA50_17905, partial [Planctomycetes bacterium]|nr:hypothetical protein [Planctomycetota bacterium]